MCIRDSINEGSKIPATKLIGLLLQQYIDYCGISLGRRTIFYDFAWSILEEHPELWYEQEKQNDFCVLANHFKEYIPGYNDSFDKFDVTVLNEGDYLVRGFNPVSYTHLRAHETVLDLVCRLLLEKKITILTNHTIYVFPILITPQSYRLPCDST